MRVKTVPTQERKHNSTLMFKVLTEARFVILAPGRNHLLLQRAEKLAGVARKAAGRADETGAIELSVLTALCESGLTIAMFGPVLGGAGLGDVEQQQTLCTILRMIGAADLSLARLFEGHANAVMLVSRYGTEAQIASLAEDVRRGALSGVWGAEDAAGLRRVRRGDCWALDGDKILASGAGFIERPLVTVGSAEGQLLYLLTLKPGERSDPASWVPLGMKATASGRVSLTGIIVGQPEQIGFPGDFMRQPFFSAGAWRFCAAQLGAMERLAELYAEQLRTRGRDGDPYQLERVAQCAAACGTALFWIEEAARRFGDESLEPSAVVAFVNLTRMVTERAALDVLERVQRGVGLPAFMRTNPIERIGRDLSTYLRQPVPDLAMSDAARAVLGGALSIGSLP
jgi:alkylation response protein AidB-like acyl-CoA dehydrogenase